MRLEALPDDSLPGGGPGLDYDGAFSLKTVKLTIATQDKKLAPAEVRIASHWISNADDSSQGRTDQKSGMPWSPAQPAGRKQVAVWAIDKPKSNPVPTTATLTLGFDAGSTAIGRFRLAVGMQAGPLDASGGEITQTALNARAAVDKQAKLSADQRQALFRDYCVQDAHWQELNAEVEKSMAERPRPHLQWMMYSSEGVPAVRLHTQGPDFYEKTYQLKRGDPNQKLSEIEPGFVQVLLRPGTPEGQWRQKPPADGPTSYRRRALANWMTDTRGGAGNLLRG